MIKLQIANLPFHDMIVYIFIIYIFQGLRITRQEVIMHKTYCNYVKLPFILHISLPLTCVHTVHILHM